MNKVIALAILASSAVVSVSAADARQGCGRGGHRGPYGHCRANVGPGYGGVRLVIGNYYGGRGYWDGRRYWQHRTRWHGGWRYR